MQISARHLQASQSARNLLNARGIPAEGRVLLLENLASSLEQSELDLSPERGSDLPAALGKPGRWTDKVRRELQQPYTDQQVFDHLDDLEADVRRLALSAIPGKTWYVAGSVAKGRFGNNSDLDLVCDGGIPPEQLAKMLGSDGWRGSALGAAFQSGDPERLNAVLDKPAGVSAVFSTGQHLNSVLNQFDEIVPVPVERIQGQPGFLSELYTSALNERGYQVDRAPDGTVNISGQRNRPLVQEPTQWLVS